jgi:hypothetical protein
LLLKRRESVAIFAQYFGDGLSLRRNNPHVIPEVSRLAGMALQNCGLPVDTIIDDTSSPYPHDTDFELEDLETEGYASLLRMERGRLRHRDLFGPLKLHYGLFQLQARHSHYLLARQDGLIVGGIGYMLDAAEKAVRIFELIVVNEQPVHCLVNGLLQRCREELGVEYVEAEVSAYSPRMQRSMLELGFLPVSYAPAAVFHQVERLDSIRMSQLLVPLDMGELHIRDAARPIAELIIKSFAAKEVRPRITQVSHDTALFRQLSDEQREKLMGICELQKFSAGSMLFSQGELNDTMHLILSGEVELIADDAHLAITSAGHCLGESSLLHADRTLPKHSVDAIARSAAETAVFTANDLNDLIRRRPDIGIVLYRNLAIDISQKLKRFSDH